jgi:hypothetical protein
MFTLNLTRAWRRTVPLLGIGILAMVASGQQLIQRGPLGKPIQVVDETEQWSIPLPVASNEDVQIYIPDVTSPDWLKRNYRDFIDRGTYTLTLFTFYRTPEACRVNQIAWGLGDKAHLDACIDIGYRVRRAKVDTQSKTVTLLLAAMLDQNGSVDPSSVQDQGLFRTWDQLDPNTLKALKKANALITDQMNIYDRKIQSTR